MIPIYTPRSESESVVIASLLKAYDIRFLIQGGEFSTLYPASVTTSLNEQVVLVDEADAEIARELLGSFLEGDAPD